MHNELQKKKTIFYYLKDITCISSLVIGKGCHRIKLNCRTSIKSYQQALHHQGLTEEQSQTRFHFLANINTYHANIVPVEKDFRKLDLGASVVTTPMLVHGFAPMVLEMARRKASRHSSRKQKSLQFGHVF